MKFPLEIKVYGDMSYRGECPSENLEQVTFFNRLRREYPDRWQDRAASTQRGTAQFPASGAPEGRRHGLWGR